MSQQTVSTRYYFDSDDHSVTVLNDCKPQIKHLSVFTFLQPSNELLPLNKLYRHIWQLYHMGPHSLTHPQKKVVCKSLINIVKMLIVFHICLCIVTGTSDARNLTILCTFRYFIPLQNIFATCSCQIRQRLARGKVCCQIKNI